MPPPHHFEEIVHKALANEVRRKILLSLSKGEKYLSKIAKDIGKQPQTIDFHLKLLYEIGLVDINYRSGKKFYSLKNKKILDFLRKGKPVPPGERPRPPHEAVIERIDKLEKKIDLIIKKLK